MPSLSDSLISTVGSPSASPFAAGGPPDAPAAAVQDGSGASGGFAGVLERMQDTRAEAPVILEPAASDSTGRQELAAAVALQWAVLARGARAEGGADPSQSALAGGEATASSTAGAPSGTGASSGGLLAAGVLPTSTVPGSGAGAGEDGGVPIVALNLGPQLSVLTTHHPADSGSDEALIAFARGQGFDAHALRLAFGDSVGRTEPGSDGSSSGLKQWLSLKGLQAGADASEGAAAGEGSAAGGSGSLSRADESGRRADGSVSDGAASGPVTPGATWLAMASPVVPADGAPWALQAGADGGSLAVDTVLVDPLMARFGMAAVSPSQVRAEIAPVGLVGSMQAAPGGLAGPAGAAPALADSGAAPVQGWAAAALTGLARSAAPSAGAAVGGAAAAAGPSAGANPLAGGSSASSTSGSKPNDSAMSLAQALATQSTTVGRSMQGLAVGAASAEGVAQGGQAVETSIGLGRSPAGGWLGGAQWATALGRLTSAGGSSAGQAAGPDSSDLGSDLVGGVGPQETSTGSWSGPAAEVKANPVRPAEAPHRPEIGPLDLRARQDEDRQALANRLGEAVAGRLLSQIEKGQWQMRLSVSPQELGPIDINLKVSGQRIEAQFQVAHLQTQSLIQDSVPRLREAVGSSGMDLASVWVSAGGGDRNRGNPTPAQPDDAALAGTLSGPDDEAASITGVQEADRSRSTWTPDQGALDILI